MKTKDEMIDWLRDAYAMERAMESMLQKQIDDLETPLLLSERVKLHLEETRGHAETVERCLRELGADTSALKTTLAKSAEMIKRAGSALAGDSVIKDLLAGYASEHFEIACYRALLTAAERRGLQPVVEACEAILIEERQMADWLAENLPDIVDAYLDMAEDTDSAADVRGGDETGTIGHEDPAEYLREHSKREIETRT